MPVDFFVITGALLVGGAILFIGTKHKPNEWWDEFIEEQVKAGNGPFNAMKKLPWWMR